MLSIPTLFWFSGGQRGWTDYSFPVCWYFPTHRERNDKNIYQNMVHGLVCNENNVCGLNRRSTCSPCSQQHRVNVKWTVLCSNGGWRLTKPLIVVLRILQLFQVDHFGRGVKLIPLTGITRVAFGHYLSVLCDNSAKQRNQQRRQSSDLKKRPTTATVSRVLGGKKTGWIGSNFSCDTFVLWR